MSFADPFTGTADQELQDRTGWTRMVDGGFRFVIDSGGTELAGKGGGGGSGFTLYACPDQGSANHETSIDWVQSTADIYPSAVRMVDQDNWVALRYGGTGSGGFRLVKNVAGTTTNIVATQGDNVLPFTAKIKADDDQYSIFEDGDQRGTTQTILNSEISTSETTQGMIQGTLSAGGTGFVDNFLAAALDGAITGSGALTSQSASMAGTAELEHTSSGSLLSQSATMSGIAELQHTASGALVSQSASMAGVAELEHTASGSLLSQSATTGGVAELEHTASGALISQSALMSGSAELEHTASGALVSQSATTSGTATVGGAITGSGALVSQSATVSGVAELEHAASGSLISQPATTSGVAFIGGILNDFKVSLTTKSIGSNLTTVTIGSNLTTQVITSKLTTRG